MTAIAAAGYLSFWVWFFSPLAGRILSFALPAAALSYVLFSFKQLDAAARQILKAMLWPLAFMASAALMILAAGFLYGGWNTPLQTEATRFTSPLAADNLLPWLFAQDIERGYVPKEIFGDWHSSDRPPLETGVVLSAFGYMRSERSYAVIGTLLQCLSLFGLWMLLSAFPVERKAAKLVLAVCLFSGFVCINSFYVWPKLLAAAFTIGFVAVLASKRIRPVMRDRPLVSALAGALLAFGVLAHGGTAFAILGFACVLPIARIRLPWKTIAIVAAAAFCLYLPWFLYQKLFDPPGDRLLKWHLAGVIPVDKRSFLQALTDAYRRTPPRQIVAARIKNFELATRALPAYSEYIFILLEHAPWQAAGDPALVFQTTREMRDTTFYLFAPNLGFLVLGLPALLFGLAKRRRSSEWRLGALLWLIAGASFAGWCLLMFSPSTTIIDQGSYAVVLFVFAGGGFVALVSEAVARLDYRLFADGGELLSISRPVYDSPRFMAPAALRRAHPFWIVATFDRLDAAPIHKRRFAAGAFNKLELMNFQRLLQHTARLGRHFIRIRQQHAQLPSLGVAQSAGVGRHAR